MTVAYADGHDASEQIEVSPTSVVKHPLHVTLQRKQTLDSLEFRGGSII